MAAEEFDIQKRYEKKKEEERKKEKGIVEDKKKVVQIIKLQIAPGAAKPGPPIGPVLGQHQLNTNDFCKEFNKLTEKMDPNLVLSVLIFKKADRSFEIKLKAPTTTYYRSQFLKTTKGRAGRYKTKDLFIGLVSQKVFASSSEQQKVAAIIDAGNRDNTGSNALKKMIDFKCIKTVLGSVRSAKLKVYRTSSF